MDSWHALSILEVFRQLDARPDGLTSTEVVDRLVHYGRNEITRRKPVSPLRLLLKQFANYFIIVLFFAAVLAYAVSFLPGESSRRLTAFFILGIILLSVALSFFEEFRAQKELEALDRLLVFKTTVLRDSRPKEIDASEIVPGDILVLNHGQKVPADARLIEAHSLRTDESALTGESVGVDKSPETVEANAPLAERTCMVYGSTFITHGTGRGVVVNTGMTTEVGQIAAALQQMSERPTPFQQEVQKMARQMTIIVAVLSIIVAAILLFVLHEPLVDVALNTLSLAVATIPESLPIVLTFALALGAREMAAHQAVIRKLSVVESLGSVDTICTDKTGTLTQNQMTVQRLFAGSQIWGTPKESQKQAGLAYLLRAAVLCNEAIIEDGSTPKITGDPVDTALLKAAQEAGFNVQAIRAEGPLTDEIPFSSERKMMTTIHTYSGRQLAFSKGAPGVVLSRCTQCIDADRQIPLADDRCQIIRQTILSVAERGDVCIGVGSKRDFRRRHPRPDRAGHDLPWPSGTDRPTKVESR